MNHLPHIKTAVESHAHAIREPYKIFFDLFGFDGIIELCGHFGGTTIYIPHVQGIFKDCIKAQILSELTFDNYKLLSTKYGVSERTVRNLQEEKE